MSSCGADWGIPRRFPLTESPSHGRLCDTPRCRGEPGRVRRIPAPRQLGQLDLDGLEFLGQITQLIELLPDQVHLIAVQGAEHLDQHGDRLLKLIHHLLLHHTELVHQRDQHRVGQSPLSKRAGSPDRLTSRRDPFDLRSLRGWVKGRECSR